MNKYLHEPLNGERKQLDLGIGTGRLSEGDISIHVYTGGYTRAQLFEAIHKALTLVKNELDPGDEAWNHFKAIEQRRKEQERTTRQE